MRKDRVVGEVLGDEVALSPSDLYNAQFKSAVMGGYDKKEVDTFLERAADMLEALLKQSREFREEMEQQREQIQGSRDMENSLRSALANVQKLEKDTLDAARRQADAMREQAKVALERAKLEARNLPDTLRREIAELSKERELLRDDLGAILRTHYALLRKIPRAEAVQAAYEGEYDDPEGLEDEAQEPWQAEGD